MPRGRATFWTSCPAYWQINAAPGLTPNTSAGNLFSGVVQESSDFAIIALNPSLPAHTRPRKDPPALCLVPDILHHIRCGIWHCVELSNIELGRVGIAPIVPIKRCIGMNRVTITRRNNSCLVEEASDSKGGASGKPKPGINLIVVEQFDQFGSIGSDIHTLNVTKNSNELPGMIAVLYIPTGSFTELLQSVVLENCQPTLV